MGDLGGILNDLIGFEALFLLSTFESRGKYFNSEEVSLIFIE